MKAWHVQLRTSKWRNSLFDLSVDFTTNILHNFDCRPSHVKFAKDHFGNASQQEAPRLIDIAASRCAYISVAGGNCSIAVQLNVNIYKYTYIDGRMVKWLERLTAVRNIDGSSPTLGS